MKNKYIILALAILCLYPALAQNNFLTQRGNNQRTGSFTNETTLNTSNVNISSFGKLFSYQVDGQIYAQPLYMQGVNVSGKGTRNVLFVTTMHNTIYVFDADSLTAPLWKTSLAPSCPLPDSNFEMYGPYHDIKVEVGTLSTPVIDSTTNTLYAVAFSKENGVYSHKLYAIDIATGSFKLNSPVTLAATVTGTGAGNNNGVLTFDSRRELQRTALVLSNGILYIMFASYADIDPYHGWILGYNATNLSMKYILNTTPNGTQGGIWMSGQGPSVDANGDIYLTTANGTFNANTGGSEYGNSFLRLHPTNNSLDIADYFTPYNQLYLNSVDADLGVDAPILIPNSNMIVGGSKEGKIYVIDRTNFGKYNTTSCNCDNQILQSFVAFSGLLYCSVAYWESNAGAYIFGVTANDHLKAFKRNGNSFGTAPSSQSTFIAPGITTDITGGILSVTSDGTKPGTGIVWCNVPMTADTNLLSIQGILRAFDATDLTKELWNSNQNSARDGSGKFAKFNCPIIVNGKVYQPTFSGQVAVYGLNPSAALREPDHPTNVARGLNYKYYEGDFSTLSGINSITPVKTDTVPDFSLAPASATDNYAFSFQGYLNIPTDGLYDFQLNSDDGSNLLIGNSMVVDNDGSHPVQEVHGSIGLKAGKHSIAVNYFQQSGPAVLEVSYSSAGFAKMPIPASELYRDSGPNTAVNTLNANTAGTFLSQNVPNPALHTTRIEFGVNKPGKVVVTLFHIDGTQVATLYEGMVNEKQTLNVDTGSLPAGIYIYKMVSEQALLTRSLLIGK